jgi:hypothetical protein
MAMLRASIAKGAPPKLRESSTDKVIIKEGALEVLAAHGQAE